MTNLPKSKKLVGQAGFTLIELSIVLVIIGLIVGGVLTGQDLIRAAEIRATVGQYEKYNAAVNTFRTKYNGIPGDLLYSSAAATGLTFVSSDGTATGNAVPNVGNGNGLITDTAAGNIQSGEALLFWNQLSSASLVDGSYGAGVITNTTGAGTGTAMTSYFPLAKLGKGNYWMVSSSAGSNYYLVTTGTIAAGADVVTTASGGMSPLDAFNIDSKIDDGMPNTGIVQARGTGVTAALLFPALAAGNAGAYAATPVSGTCLTGGGTTSATDTTDTYARTTAAGSSPACGLLLRFN